MKKWLIALGILILVILAFVFIRYTGSVVGVPEGNQETIGPSAEEQSCMLACASQGCAAGDQACMMNNSEKCLTQCNVQKPESNEETSCMEACVVNGCGELDFNCQANNKDKCEQECEMIKEPAAKSEEEQCIRDCVAKVDPNIMCQASKEGEAGNDVCKRCAEECVYLYAGPCLEDKELKEKQAACVTCEHCYGETVMGDSGEGWECIVDVECKDASSEFGDNPGIGEGIAKGIGNIVEGIGDFFRNLFGGDNNSDQQTNENNNVPESGNNEPSSGGSAPETNSEPAPETIDSSE